MRPWPVKKVVKLVLNANQFADHQQQLDEMSLALVVLARNINSAAAREREKKASRHQGIVVSIGLAAGLDPAWIFSLRGITKKPV